jgi:hypothetical protein
VVGHIWEEVFRDIEWGGLQGKEKDREGKGNSGIEEKSQKDLGGGGGFYRHTLIDSNELVLVAVAAESIILDQW